LSHARRSLGDIILAANAWIFNPQKPHRGNASVGIGLLLPTGNDDVQNTVNTTVNGATVRVTAPVDYSIQPGNGGYGMVTQWQGFRAVGNNLIFYTDGDYIATQGDTNGVANLRGKIVVLNFWATWCEPCQEELPRLSVLAEAYAGKNVQFVSVSIDDEKSRSKIEPLLRRLNVGLDVWTGADLDTLGKFGLGNIVPATVVIDDRGEVISRVMGEARDEDVRTPVDWLLSGRTGNAPPPLLKRY
jgi:thiol-disulfide isomerase/thioredoxin